MTVASNPEIGRWREALAGAVVARMWATDAQRPLIDDSIAVIQRHIATCALGESHAHAPSRSKHHSGEGHARAAC